MIPLGLAYNNFSISFNEIFNVSTVCLAPENEMSKLPSCSIMCG